MRLDKFCLRNSQRLLQHFGQFVGQNRAMTLARAYKSNGKEPAFRSAIDRPIRFPNAIGVSCRMILVTDEQNLCPEVRLETVLCFDYRKIIAGGYDAAIEHHKIILARGKNDLLLLAGAESERGDKQKEETMKT